jgi:hypothetical protein
LASTPKLEQTKKICSKVSIELILIVSALFFLAFQIYHFKLSMSSVIAITVKLLLISFLVFLRLSTLRVFGTTNEDIVVYNHNETDERIFEVDANDINLY